MTSLQRILVLPLALAIGGATSCYWGTGKDRSIKEVKGASFRMQVFDNSQSLSRVIAVNENGSVIGMREELDETEAIFSQVYFFSDGQTTTSIPKLDGYTNLEVVSLSDTGIVVGFASRTLGHPEGSLTAIAWDASTGQLENLGAAEGELVSHAQDISADGTRITGYTTGSNPARLRPCVWDRKGDGWEITVLSTIELMNPYLMSSSAVISPDGKTIAACITENLGDAGQVDSSLFMWQQTDGEWLRQKVCDDQMRLHDINNDGVVVGDVTRRVGRLPCTVGKDGVLVELPLLEGDKTGEAWGINTAGLIVGVSDDPNGPEGGPQPVIWKDGSVERLDLPKTTMFGSASCINDKGQVGGLADITFENEKEENPETGEKEPVVRTIGFLWNMKQ